MVKDKTKKKSKEDEQENSDILDETTWRMRRIAGGKKTLKKKK